MVGHMLPISSLACQPRGKGPVRDNLRDREPCSDLGQAARPSRRAVSPATSALGLGGWGDSGPSAFYLVIIIF